MYWVTGEYTICKYPAALYLAQSLVHAIRNAAAACHCTLSLSYFGRPKSTSEKAWKDFDVFKLDRGALVTEGGKVCRVFLEKNADVMRKLQAVQRKLQATASLKHVRDVYTQLEKPLELLSL